MRRGQRILSQVGGVLIAASVLGCSPIPIQFERWNLAPLSDDVGEELRSNIQVVETELFGRCVSPEGLLWYRRPVEESATSGAYLDLADQACWSGYWLAGLVFRQEVEPTVEHLRAVERALTGLELLERVTGIDGLIARCVAPIDIWRDVAHHPETWRECPDLGLAYRSDVSKDQYSGLVFGLTVGAVVLPPGPIRQRCRDFLVRCARHLEAGDLRILDADGEVTEFGDLRGRILGAPIGVNSAISLSLMRAWERFTPDASERARARERSESLVRSLEPLHVEFLGIRNYSNALMAAASLASLLIVETESVFRSEYLGAVAGFMGDFVGEGNVFFRCVAALGGVRDSDEDRVALRNLRTATTDVAIVALPTHTYDDVPRRWIPARNGKPRTREALPLAVRPPTSFRWRTDPYTIDLKVGADGSSQVSGVDLFVAYWFGRYAGLVPPPSSGT